MTDLLSFTGSVNDIHVKAVTFEYRITLRAVSQSKQLILQDMKQNVILPRNGNATDILRVRKHLSKRRMQINTIKTFPKQLTLNTSKQLDVKLALEQRANT